MIGDQYITNTPSWNMVIGFLYFVTNIISVRSLSNLSILFSRYLILLLDRRMPTPKRLYFAGPKKLLIGIQMLVFTISPIRGGMALHSMQSSIAIGE